MGYRATAAGGRRIGMGQLNSVGHLVVI